MDIEAVQKSFRNAVTESVRLSPEGIDRYQIFTPFQFDDGDHFVVVLRKGKQGNWIITDEGHTYMHLSYWMDSSSIESGNRNAIIEDALEKHGIQEKEGQILAELKDFENAGNVFYNFIQCLINITDVSYLSRERVVSTFMEDFRSFIGETVEPQRRTFDYHHEEHDPDGKYPVDCLVNGMSRPLHIYAIGNNDKCRDTTICILQHQKWNIPFLSVGIFEDQEEINRKVLARFTDVCDCQFSNLATNMDKIRIYLQENMH